MTAKNVCIKILCVSWIARNETCKSLSVGAPEIHEHLCEECHDHFEELKTYLTAANVQYTLNPRLVRGLDYYTKNSI